MGRKMLYREKREAAFPEGTQERITAVLAPGENSASFVRLAVERELERRERAGPQKAAEGR
jgi:hypothetical protein